MVPSFSAENVTTRVAYYLWPGISIPSKARWTQIAIIHPVLVPVTFFLGLLLYVFLLSFSSVWKALKGLHGQVTLRKRIWRDWNFWLVLVFFSHQLHKHPAANYKAAISVSGCGWGQITTGQRKSTSPWAKLQSFGHGQKLPFHWRKPENSI